jgi:eukaryotic-like serine/threonine-protein kinase
VRADQLIAERYRLLNLIAVGGMGEVWQASDERLGRRVAVKLLKPEYGREPSFLARFRGEARHAAALSHPGIAAVYDYGEVQDDGQVQAYLVMELVEGEPLSQLLARGGALGVGEAMEIVGQAGLALQAAHDAGVIHRDIKPANLLIVRPDPADPSAVTVKITDFGIARAVDAAPLTRTGMVMGTAHYLSPEQARAETITPSSDIYSLGVVAYECLTGRRPFTGDTAFAIAAAHATRMPPPLPLDLPEPVRALVAQAMAKSPRDRPASAGAFGRAALRLAATYRDVAPSSAVGPTDALTQLLEPVPSAASSPPTRLLAATSAAAEPPPRRRPVWPWIVLLLVVAAAVGSAWALSSSGTGTPLPSLTPSPTVHTSTAHPTTPAPTTHKTTARPTTTRPTTTTAAPTTTTAAPTTTAPTTTTPPPSTAPPTTGAATSPAAASGVPPKAIGRLPGQGRGRGRGHHGG